MWIIAVAVLAIGGLAAAAFARGTSTPGAAPGPAPSESMTPQFLAGVRDEYRRKIVEPNKVNWDPNKYLTTHKNVADADIIQFDFSMLGLADANKLAAQTPTKVGGFVVFVKMPQAK